MQRLEAIDKFRGFAFLLMIIANYLNNVNTIPSWLKHSKDIGYTAIDLIAPMFVFAIGLTYGISFRRRLSRDGAWNTYQQFITRYLALLGLGYVITLAWELSGIQPPNVNWGLLQALGAAGLIALLFIRLPTAWRGVIGLGLLVVYQLILDRAWLDDVLIAPHNGPWGALNWGALLILSTVLGDIYHQVSVSQRIHALISAGCVAAGLLFGLLVPVSKHRASASYMILSLGLSALIFYLFHLLQDRNRLNIPILTDWGRNPLLLYLAHYVIIGIYFLIPNPSLYQEASIWLVIMELTLMIGTLSWVGHYLNKRKLYFVL